MSSKQVSARSQMAEGLHSRQVWAFPDPAQANGLEEERFQLFRAVRDGIRGRLSEWLAPMGISPMERT